MNSTPLATFIHISDLHLGPHISRLKSWIPLVKHTQGHDFRAISFLEQFYRDERQKDENVSLIMTGDLTSYGDHRQFRMGVNYLSYYHTFSEGRPLGLNTLDWRLRAIPGNHDHWPGRRVCFGSPTEGLRRVFPQIPFLRRFILPTNIVLTFIGIDADSGVNPFSLNRFLARGAFGKELRGLSQRLSQATGGMAEIRVLLIHHSRAYRGIWLEMNPNSRQRLDDFILNNNIAVLLTGHIHIPHIQPYPLNKGLQKVHFLEARCGTTTQFLGQPGARSQPQARQNTLLLHRVVRDGHKIYWQAETHVLGKSGGFKRYNAEPHLSAIPNLEGRIQVWPR